MKVVLFFLQNSTQIPSLEVFIIIYVKYFFMKFINLETKGQPIAKKVLDEKGNNWKAWIILKLIWKH